MKRWIFAIFSMILLVPLARATVNDGHVVTTVGYVTHEMGTLQDKIPSQTGTKAMTFGDDAGEIGARTVKTDLGTSTSDDSLPTVGAVNDKLDDKQDILPAKNTNTVLTYTGVEGSVGEKGIYQDSGTYANQMDSLVTAGTFNAALKNGLDNEFVCAETDPSTGQCWAYSINNSGGPWNYFYMNAIPERTDRYGSTIARNADGSLTVTIGTNIYTYAPKLKVLAPGLEIGKRYKFNITTTGTQKYIYLSGAGSWDNNQVKTITSSMLNSDVFLYASGKGTTATISEIKITAVDSGATGTTILPDGYTPLEYIETTGTQYIVLPAFPNTSNIDITMDVMHTDGTNEQIIFAPASSIQPLYTSSSWWRVWKSGITNYPLIGHADRHKFTIKTTSSGGLEYYVDGQQKTNIPSDFYTSGIFAGKTLYLGARSTTNADYFWKGKIYSFAAECDGVVCMNLIPAKRNVDNAIGMYDMVSESFKANAGTGDFIAGPTVSNNLYIPQNQ